MNNRLATGWMAFTGLGQGQGTTTAAAPPAATTDWSAILANTVKLAEGAASAYIGYRASVSARHDARRAAAGQLSAAQGRHAILRDAGMPVQYVQMQAAPTGAGMPKWLVPVGLGVAALAVVGVLAFRPGRRR